MERIYITTILIGFWIQSSLLVSAVADTKQLKLWPMPQSVSYGHERRYIGKEFELKTEGSKYNDGSSILKNAIVRLLDVVPAGHVIEANFSSFNPSHILKGINVVIRSSNDELQYGVDESYKLLISAQGDLVNLEAETIYGALHGLQTFSQLCRFISKTRAIEVHQVPWIIVDEPRFSYRGLLIDTSRHYLPLPVMKKVINSMTYAKLNVLHWHIVDSQSFPLEIPSLPKMWNGAYSREEQYTMADAAEIVSYAQQRGINVLAEIDIPGHARSWGVGYPSLWSSTECKEPLDVSNDYTFKVIDSILSDFSEVFKFKFVHLGGDEVDTSCWTSTPHINKWLQKNRLNASEAYQFFVLRAQKIALAHGYEIINWEETFNNFGDKLSRKTVVHNWLGGGVAERVVASGLRCIVSNQDKWYLDHLDATWQGFYSNEPLTNITDTKQQALVLWWQLQCVSI
ncbi:hypothetical protein Leryth_026539 [Lithospermum erythrorhizon]|nr:hypothetical protein Leryth_026539 [Lithospermum erythrorhizon]